MKLYLFLFLQVAFLSAQGRVLQIMRLGRRALSSTVKQHEGVLPEIVQSVQVTPKRYPTILDNFAPITKDAGMHFHNCDVKVTMIHAPENSGVVGGHVEQTLKHDVRVDNSVHNQICTEKSKPWWRKKDFWMGAASGSGVVSIISWLAHHLPGVGQ